MYEGWEMGQRETEPGGGGGGRMLGRRKEKATGKGEVLLWLKYMDRHQMPLPPLPPPTLRSCLQSVVQVQNQLLLRTVLNTTCLPSEPCCPGMRSAWRRAPVPEAILSFRLTAVIHSQEAKMTQLLGFIDSREHSYSIITMECKHPESSVLVHLKLLFAVKDWQSNS